jgi:hypothetical protein
LRWVQASEEGLTTPEYSVQVSVDASGRPSGPSRTGIWVKVGSASVKAAMFRFAFATGGWLRFAASSIAGKR